MKISDSYNFKTIEKIITDFWANDAPKWEENTPTFTILMPPPNVTGSLHLGHALNNFLQDVLVRFARLQGKKTLWIPGFDHAGIATEIMVRKWIKTNRWTVSSAKDLNNYFQQWVQEQKTTIVKQWRKLGLLLNQKHSQYTFSSQVQEIVKKTFVDLYQAKLIYRAKKLVNFDLQLQTVLSDIEVVHKTQQGKLYYINYQNANQTKMITIATTRPETIFADQALLIHPDDYKWKEWQGEKVINPLTKQLIPILTSKTVNPKFGSGVVKCTPGHDFADFTIGQELKLQSVVCFDKKGMLNALTGEFKGQDRLVVKDKIVQQLQQQQQLVKIATIQHTLPYSSKSDTLLEPILSDQWFVKTVKWAQELLQIEEQVKFLPSKYQIQFRNWLKNCQDWCISRQLSWGHRLPLYFHNDGRMLVAESMPNEKGWTQSSDVLDTWFSSALWSVINSNAKEEKAKQFSGTYAYDYLVTSYDIIFFWVTKMLFFHHYLRGKIPFKQILIHGLVRQQNNEKMSKSKGNALNPLELISKFGVDSLRVYLLGDHKIGEDLKFNEKKLIQASQFCNKVWNINRFLNNLPPNNNPFDVTKCKNPLNHWLYGKWQQLLEEHQNNFNQHRWSVVMQNLIEFVWKDLGNNYLTLAKQELQKNVINNEINQMLHFIWKQTLLLLHPFLPFLSEFIWQKQIEQKGKSILTQTINFNVQKPIKDDQSKLITTFFWIIDYINKLIRKNNFRQKITIKLLTPEAMFYQKHLSRLNQYLQLRQITIDNIETHSLQQIEFIDNKKEIHKILRQEIATKAKELIKKQKVLSNPAFKNKATKQTIIQMKKECTNLAQTLFDLKEKLKRN